MNNNIWVTTSTLEVQSNNNKNWSSEDEMNLMNAILASEKEWGVNSCTAKWLKSIKGRVQPHPKQEWSEEDERMLDNIVFELEENEKRIIGVTYKIDWLKSLKEKMQVTTEKKEARYEIHLYQYIGDNGDVDEENAHHIYEDDLYRALSIAARYYRHTKNPLVNIFDNEIGDYIAEWD